MRKPELQVRRSLFHQDIRSRIFCLLADKGRRKVQVFCNRNQAMLFCRYCILVPAFRTDMRRLLQRAFVLQSDMQALLLSVTALHKGKA